jgi:hypothetical protein
MDYKNELLKLVEKIVWETTSNNVSELKEYAKKLGSEIIVSEVEENLMKQINKKAL